MVLQEPKSSKVIKVDVETVTSNREIDNLHHHKRNADTNNLKTKQSSHNQIKMNKKEKQKKTNKVKNLKKKTVKKSTKKKTVKKSSKEKTVKKSKSGRQSCDTDTCLTAAVGYMKTLTGKAKTAIILRMS